MQDNSGSFHDAHNDSDQVRTSQAKRFILQKRQSQASWTRASAPEQQFQSAPRFCLHGPGVKLNRPPAPTVGRNSYGRDPICDSFSPSPPTSPHHMDNRVSCSQINLDAVPETPAGEERPSKRRRLSISSCASSPLASSPSTWSPPSVVGRERSSAEPDQPHSVDWLESPRNRAIRSLVRTPTGNFRPEMATKPAFLSLPRFKPTETKEDSREPGDPHGMLSPPRRGDRYIKGGLAAEVGLWIRESLARSQQIKRIHVVEARKSADIQLVRGTVAQDGAGITVTTATEVCGQEVKLIVGNAGTTVEPGSSLTISPPAWDIELGQDDWRVAYHWTRTASP